MKTKFVQTSNVNRFLTGVAALDDRAAPEACFALIQGQAGLGKTRTAKWWAMQHNAVFLRIQESMSPTWLLRDLVNELGDQVPANRVEKLFQQVVSTMAPNPRPIVVDEAERAIKNISILENLRDLSDMMEMPVVLVGREFTLSRLKRHTQIYTRISSTVSFERAKRADVVQLATELCEVKVSDDLIDIILKQADGYVREIMKALKNVERLGRRNRTDTVLADMVKNVDLCREDAKAGRAA